MADYTKKNIKNIAKRLNKIALLLVTPGGPTNINWDAVQDLLYEIQDILYNFNDYYDG